MSLGFVPLLTVSADDLCFVELKIRQIENATGVRPFYTHPGVSYS